MNHKRTQSLKIPQRPVSTTGNTPSQRLPLLNVTSCSPITSNFSSLSERMGIYSDMCNMDSCISPIKHSHSSSQDTPIVGDILCPLPQRKSLPVHMEKPFVDEDLYESDLSSSMKAKNEFMEILRHTSTSAGPSTSSKRRAMRSNTGLALAF